MAKTIGKFKSTGRRQDAAPPEPHYYLVLTSGQRQDGADERTHHVCASEDAEAREMVEMIETLNGEHYGTARWEIADVTECGPDGTGAEA